MNQWLRFLQRKNFIYKIIALGIALGLWLYVAKPFPFLIP